jgi:hypothetical protein
VVYIGVLGRVATRSPHQVRRDEPGRIPPGLVCG